MNYRQREVIVLALGAVLAILLAGLVGAFIDRHFPFLVIAVTLLGSLFAAWRAYDALTYLFDVLERPWYTKPRDEP